ncbi:pyridine nucleotide-disulfide oxidoreductase [Nocardia mangyaensis]|uniref:Pyridine nucleotide-disulfide oxidoreductase n=1 Tax=Nocardia mangyaensis TaxID=2213200 RepID=A0A1J0VZ22_9NOCA|nr:NAD(P)/FAD-dependent oxidoreductase [Nocardia mangyaensis]APE37254.1 pyridine nucleotide-disulfide oxidoreductase [Nocardia mangyaensis]
MTDAEYDVIVLGAGPAGENAAAYAIAGSDRTAALVERELFGGECSYWACIPSKALLRPGAVLDLGESMPGVTVSGPQVADVLARRDAFVHDHDDSSQVEWAKSARIDPIRGAGRLAGERLVEVDTGDGVRVLRARHAVVLATGTTAAIPNIPGVREALPWTSRDATALTVVPRRVAIVGGGVVACETATWLAELGAEEVTLLVRGDRLLPRVEPFAAGLVLRGLRDTGVVTVRLRTEPHLVSRRDPADTGVGRIHGGPVTVVFDGGELEVDELVVATGRAPSTEHLGLDTVGLPAGYVEVDDQLTVRAVPGEWLYAVGDVNHRAALTHMGKYQARVCGDVIAARAEGKPLDLPRYTASADHQQVPQVVYTAPELAAVGLTEQQARDAGHAVDTVELDIEVAGSSLSRDDFHGRAKLVVDTAADRLLGATFVGPDMGEQLHAATIAVVGRVPLETLWNAVPAFPTVSEFWLRLLEARRER